MTKRLPRPRYVPTKLPPRPVRSATKWPAAELAVRFWLINRAGVTDFDPDGKRIVP